MALVFSDRSNNLYAYIYSNDHIPAHIHIFIGRKKSRSQKNIKISIGDDEKPPEILLAHPSIENSTIKKAWRLVVENQMMLQEKWKEIHKNKTYLGRKRKKQTR